MPKLENYFGYQYMYSCKPMSIIIVQYEGLYDEFSFMKWLVKYFFEKLNKFLKYQTVISLYEIVCI